MEMRAVGVRRPGLRRAGQRRHRTGTQGAQCGHSGRGYRRPACLRGARGRRTHHHRPRGSPGRGHRRPLHGRRPRLLRTFTGRGETGGIQGLYQGFPRAARHSHRELRRLHRGHLRSAIHPGTETAPGGQGRWPRRRQGRRHLRDPRSGPRRRDGHARRRLRRCRRDHRDRGIPARRGSQLHRHRRRSRRAASRHFAGSQAPRRRRSGTEHRRHGRLFSRPPWSTPNCTAASCAK